MDDERFARGTGHASSVSKPYTNTQTVVRVPGGVFDREAMAGPIALARYESALREAANAYARDRVFVVLLDSDGSRSKHRVLGPGQSLVFGRHERAHLRHESHDLSLRHIAVAVAPSSTAEAPMLRVWDLATGRPFKTEDGMPSEALTADGPIFATLGSVHLGIIPLGSLPEKLPIGTVALWRCLPDREVLSRVAQGSQVLPFVAPALKPNASSKEWRTSVTRVPAASGPIDCPMGEAVAELRLISEGARRVYRVSEEALQRGILIGRYQRCMNVAEELSILSRVHLLISKIGNDVVAIDTASTFGSTQGEGQDFATIVLAAQDNMILADALWVEWKYERLVLA